MYNQYAQLIVIDTESYETHVLNDMDYYIKNNSAHLINWSQEEYFYGYKIFDILVKHNHPIVEYYLDYYRVPKELSFKERIGYCKLFMKDKSDT